MPGAIPFSVVTASHRYPLGGQNHPVESHAVGTSLGGGVSPWATTSPGAGTLVHWAHPGCGHP